MNFQSSYRKYRPTDFNSVVGQENIVKTLENAIEQDKLAHAYLFNGPRGTGKTSIAKIFARKINCTCDDNSCLTCNSSGELADIIEMDAASNNGVEEIRRIIDNVYFTPMELKYKVYIIDEVHMLSKSAFNALLKTLEEPPKHVKFILATTEIHKIPATIISRCQRYDFKRISIGEMVKRLEHVLKAEEVNYDEAGVQEIAKLADGGMRDALSLLDKVIMLTDQAYLSDVLQALNIVSTASIRELIDAINDHDVDLTVKLWSEFYQQGIDETKFIIDLQYSFREVLAVQLAAGQNKQVRSTITQLKQLNDLETRLMYTRNCAMLIEVFLIDLAMKPQAVNQQITEVNKVQQINKVDNDEHLEKIRLQKEQLLKEQKITDNKMQLDEVDPLPMTEDKVEHVDSYEAPVEPEQVIPTQTKILDSNVIILDVLQTATKLEKNNLIANSMELARNLEVQNKLGLAKFVELAQVVAVSKLGVVMTIEQQYLESYLNRLSDIEAVYSQFLNYSCKIFLLSFQEWESKRGKYIEELKTYSKENDIFSKAQTFFGTDKVNKI